MGIAVTGGMTLATALGLNKAITASALNGYILKSGRVVTYRMGNHNGILLTSKHENSVSYNQSMDYVRRFGHNATVMVLVDAISRKYYTGETSWLYDVDFEALNCEGVSKILLCGTYAYDLALRFSFTGILPEKIVVEPNVEKGVSLMRREDGDGDSFVITCFSDKDKFLSRLTEQEVGV